MESFCRRVEDVIVTEGANYILIAIVLELEFLLQATQVYLDLMVMSQLFLSKPFEAMQ